MNNETDLLLMARLYLSMPSLHLSEGEVELEFTRVCFISLPKNANNQCTISIRLYLLLN